MKTIEVSDEMYNSLIELSKEINKQDNRGTAMPYFYQIETKEKVAAPEGCGEEIYVCDDTEIETEQEINDAIAAIKEDMSEEEIKKLSGFEKEEILLENDWRKVNYKIEEKYQNAFLTEKACKEHIRLNGYHYREPRDYLTHAFRNPDMETILKFLCELTYLQYCCKKNNIREMHFNHFIQFFPHGLPCEDDLNSLWKEQKVCDFSRGSDGRESNLLDYGTAVKSIQFTN